MSHFLHEILKAAFITDNGQFALLFAVAGAVGIILAHADKGRQAKVACAFLGAVAYFIGLTASVVAASQLFDWDFLGLLAHSAVLIIHAGIAALALIVCAYVCRIPLFPRAAESRG